MYNTQKNIKKTLTYMFLIAFALLTIIPLAWMVLLSFKTSSEIFNAPFALPKAIQWQNYLKAWKVVGLGTLMKNSLFVTSVSTAITLFASTLCSYAIARIDFKWNFKLYFFLLFGLMIPVYIVMFPMFRLNQILNLSGSYISLIGPYVAFQIPTCTLIMVGFLRGIPKELEEAASIDGASLWRILFEVIFPVLKPAFATATILILLNNWNEFVLALVLITKNKMKTLPVGIAAISGQYNSNYEIMAAALIISVIPIIVVYLILKKNIIEGMTAGAVKG
ncbi:MAG: carbohydrate transporter permease [Clostridia bacterium]|jgi:raffinose/stachyose/melibiose transport system permease protein|nr:carbohydrate transporter permease [Clostridia bacterium]